MYFRYIFLFLLFFTASIVSAQTTVSIEHYNQSLPVVTTVATSTTPFSYNCVIGQTLTEFSIYTRSGASTRTLTLFVDNATTTGLSITATPAWSQWTGLNFVCNDGTFDIKFTISGSTFYVYGTQGDNSGKYVMPYVASGSNYGVIHRSTYTYSSSGSTVYVPINQYVTTAVCGGTPTSTCSFTYSTTTATTTDYTDHLDFMLLLWGVLLFAIGIAMFRSLAKKYL